MNSKINMAERQQDFVSIAMWDVISLCRHNDITPRELYTACTRCKSAVGRNYTQAPYKAKALFNSLGFSYETIRNFFGRTYPQPIKATLEALVASGKLVCISNGSTYNKASGTRSFFTKRYLPTLEQAETVYADTQMVESVLNLAGMSKHGRKWVAKICAMRKRETPAGDTPAQETPAEKPQPAKPQPKKQLEKPNKEKTMTTKAQPITPPEEETPQQATPQQVPPQLTIEALQRTISQGALTTKEAATIYATISGQSHKFTRARGGETDYLDFTLWTPQQKLAWCDTMRAFGRWIKASGKRTADYGLEKWWLYRKEYVQSIYAEAKGV